MPTAIIIDDIPQAIENLREDLTAFCSDVKIIGTAGGVVSGAKLLREKTPDILFLDIQMQDGSGFDLLEILPEIKFKVIFTTASDAYAIKAFKFSAIDYLLKPIDPDELMEAVKKANVEKGQTVQLDLLKNQIQTKKAPQKLALHTLEKIHIVDLKEVLRLESSGNYTQFYFLNGQKLLVTKTLKEFDKMLSDNGYFRVHQSHLINLEEVKEFVKTDGGYLVMKDGSRIPVSVRKRARVVKMLEGL